jgi:alkyldihydroxyacetonephosphate synthase
MRRWNGWGDDEISYPLPPTAVAYLADLLGPGERISDARFEDVLATMPASRLAPQPHFTTDGAERLRHARGQSLPDWIALRYGRVETFPDAVAFPTSASEIRRLLRYAADTGIQLIPYGGGTSVAGHINPLPGERAALTVNLGRLNRLLAFDESSHLATIEAGASGPEIEAQLGARGYTLGHFPQSFDYSTLGGWIATRSTGQQSYYYGRIEALFAGGQVETPVGTLTLPPLPASAAGPDLRHLILGSEGRLGIISSATVRVRRRPEQESFQAVFMPDWESGVAAMRSMAQAAVPVSMLRLSNAQETATTLALGGRARLVSLAERALRLLRYGPERCLLLFGVTAGAVSGGRRAARQTQRQATAVARDYGGLPVGSFIGNQWRHNRFRAPYLRNSLWQQGYAIDTVETAVPWSAVQATTAAVTQAIEAALADSGERVLVLAHLSHAYVDGASIYVTYLYRRATGAAETLRRWQIIKTAASQAIVRHGGTISHQHGVGLDHAPYLAAEKGALGMALLQDACRRVDPGGVLNPGKLVSSNR